jgi:hypothetical protein
VKERGMRVHRGRLPAVVAVGLLATVMTLGAGTATAAPDDGCTIGGISGTSNSALCAPGSSPSDAPAAALGPAASDAPATAVTMPPAPSSATVQSPIQKQAVVPAATVPATGGGGYINSGGNYVPSPASASSPPSGATARCNDGTYSFSQNRSGTCSDHGGVAQFLTSGSTSSQSMQPVDNGYRFNGQYWQNGDGHRNYGRYWDKNRRCWLYAAPPQEEQAAAKFTEVASVPKGGVDTGDGSFGD